MFRCQYTVRPMSLRLSRGSSDPVIAEMLIPVIPNSENACALVVTYCPDSEFIHRLERIRALTSTVCIVDNGSGELFPHIESQGVMILRNVENRGIAAALNRGAEWATAQGFSWVLLFDQDTLPSPDLLRKIADAYNDYPSKSRLAMIGSHFGAEYQPSACTNERWRRVTTVINSGTLLSLTAFSTIGGFREDFFLDCVDLDYCLRACRKGLDVIELTSQAMKHSIGRASHHQVLGRVVTTSNHAPWRWYYMTRNNLILIRESIQFAPYWAFQAIYSRLRGTTLMFLFEDQRIAKAKFVVAGFLDGLLGTQRYRPVPVRPACSPARDE